MTETSPEQLPSPAEAPSAPLAGHSILDTVRSIRAKQQAAEQRQLELAVPGYEDRLAVIYRFPPEGIERILRSVERMVEAEGALGKVEAASDRLIACCAAIVGRDENGKPIDLLTGERIAEHELPEAPFKFDLAFADRIGIEIPGEVKNKGRFIVRSLFSPRAHLTGVWEGDLALISTSQVLFSWLNGADAEVEEATAGE